MKCRDPEDRASLLMLSAKENNVKALMEMMNEETFAEMLFKNACCFAGFNAMWFAVREDSSDWFREVAKWHSVNGRKINAHVTARTRNGNISMESMAKYSPKIGRMLKAGFIREGISWKVQRLMWIGRTDCDSAFFRVPKELIRMMVAACATRYEFV